MPTNGWRNLKAGQPCRKSAILLSVTMSAAARDQRIARSQRDGVSLPPLPDHRQRFLTMAELQDLADCAGPYLLMILAIASGVGETRTADARPKDAAMTLNVYAWLRTTWVLRNGCGLGVDHVAQRDQPAVEQRMAHPPCRRSSPNCQAERCSPDHVAVRGKDPKPEM
jgi:hypothetical protein